MSRRVRLTAYLVVAHAGAGVAAWYGLRGASTWTWWLAEAVLVVSLLVGLKLVADVFAAVRFVDESQVLLATSDVMSRVRAVGQPQIDRLIDLYNTMIDQLRAERVGAREQQHFLAQVLAESPAAILVLDFDGRIAHLNPAATRVLGITPPMSGQRLADVAPWLDDLLRQLSPRSARVVTRGTGRRVRVVAGAFVDRGFSRQFVLAEELTEEMRQMERAAHEKLIRVLSHEVNNTVGASGSLLASCLTYAPHLPAADRQDFEHAIDIVRSRTAQLGTFLSGFADVYRLPPPRLEPCDLRVMAAEAVALLRGRANAYAVSVRLDGEAGWPVVHVDRAQFGQVVLNVVKNAIEAAGQGGWVRLACRPATGAAAASLIVEDSGPGLSPEARANLFTPFFSTKDGGQGVGLTFVQEVLSNHGCDFALDANAEGVTTFTIAFR